jgi:RNA polymerase sigma-70 factor (ECF subfamily)
MSEPDWESLLSEQVRLNSRLFYRLAHRLLRDDAAAQDVCQQAFRRVWEHRSRIVDPSVNTVRNWILQTVKTDCLQRLRRRKIEQRVLGTYAAAQPDIAYDPQTPKDLRDGVLAAIALLPEPTQTMVKLWYLDGMTANEVMVVFGCRRSDFWRHMRWGLDQLRGLLSDDWRFDRD